MRQIWKYPLEFGVTRLKLPYCAEVLTCAMQGTVPCIWALVSPDETETEQREFSIFGTGLDIPHEVSVGGYIATFQMVSGALVFHVFETTRG